MAASGTRSAPRMNPPGWLVSLGFAAVVVFVLYEVRGVLTPIAFAFFIAYLLDPLVDRFEAMRIPRALGIVLLLSLVFLAGGVFLLVTIPGVVSDVSEFGEALPGKVAALSESMRGWLAELGVEHVPTSLHELLEDLERSGADTTSMAGRAVAPVAGFLETVVGGTVSMVSAAAGGVDHPGARVLFASRF